MLLLAHKKTLFVNAVKVTGTNFMPVKEAYILIKNLNA